ncbi:MAG: HPr family phosphocarrier protein [Lachnospiraceae bacterium]
MIQKTVTVNMDSEMEARSVAVMVQLASQYQSSIYVESDGQKRVNAKSIMGMMYLCLNNGTPVTLTASGNDEQEAIDGLEHFLTGSDPK